MDLVYVDSSNVDQIGFDVAASELHVLFKNGRHYIYSDVAQETYDAFLNAPSKGTFLNQEIKAKGYPYRQV